MGTCRGFMDHVGSTHLLIRLVLVGLLGVGFACGEDPGCRVQTDRQGKQVLHCPGGGSVGVGEGTPDDAFGTLRGTIRRFGYDSNEGIHVRMKGVNVAFDTAADGRWEVPELPVGWYGAEFTYPGYQPIDLARLAVLPGDNEIEGLELRIGSQVIDGRKWRLLPSPSGKGALAHEQDGRLLWIDPARADPVWLGNSVRSPSFTAGGERVLYLDEVSSGRKVLKAYDTETRVRTTIGERVVRWEVDPEGDIVAYVREIEQDQMLLEVWNRLAETHTPVALSPFSWTLADEARVVLARVPDMFFGQALVVWDIASEMATALRADGGDFPAVGPDGVSFVFRDPSGAHHLWLGKQSQALSLGHAPTSWTFGPDGNGLLVGHADGNLYRWDLHLGTRELVGSDVLMATWSPDAETVAFVRWTADGRQQIRILDPESGSSLRVTEAERVLEAGFSPDASTLFAVVRSPTGGRQLLSFTLEEGLEDVGAAAALPVFAPDGGGYAFHADGSIWYRDRAPGSEAVEVLAGVHQDRSLPVGWWDDFLWVASHSRTVGSLRVLDRRSGAIVWEAEGVHAPSIRATAGGLFYLDDCNAVSDRGRLVRWHPSGLEVIHTGVRLADEGSPLSAALRATFTPGGVGFFQSDAWPERVPRILALYDPNRDEAIPMDAWVTQAVAGESWLLWTVDDEDEEPRSGVHVARLPLPTRPPEAP